MICQATKEKPLHTLVNAQESRDLDGLVARHLGISGFELMQRAGQAAFDLLIERMPETDAISVFCGKGNNAGDGYLIAALAKRLGMRVQLFQIDPGALTGDAALARDYAAENGVRVAQPDEAISGQVVVDALLGTGLKGELREPYATAVARINEHPGLVLAVDLPTGVETDTGAVRTIAVVADLTVTFIADKIGLRTGAAKSYTGKVVLRSLEAPETAHPKGIPYLTCDDFDVAALDENAYKHARGHLLVIGGDHNMGGAPLLSGEAALRTGAGLVTVATRPEHRTAMLARRPELMVIDATDDDLFSQVLARADAVAIGPGLGSSSWAQDLIARMQEHDIPLLVDADGLRLWDSSARTGGLVLTPHAGEAAALLNVPVSAVSEDRIGAAVTLSQQYGAAVILKGAGSVVAMPDEGDHMLPEPLRSRRLGICAHGNPGMASAGMGDALSGISGALLAEGCSAGYAAAWGMCLHSWCGDQAAQRVGQRALLASDVIQTLALGQWN
jgi:NAD(P)H-hydrate epimerase